MDPSERTFDDALAGRGFRAGHGRRGETVWTLRVNRHLTVAVHPDGDHAIVSWAFGLGEYVEEHGWRLSVTDTSTAELYPQRDVRIERSADALDTELRRVRQQLRWDLGADDG
ncbi:MAG: hypothetical protein WD011_04910 [Nitriliruptoraceae bacterium]